MKVQGQAEVTSRVDEPHLFAHSVAMQDAVLNFVNEHGRMPDWDIVSFRGGHSTTTVVIEIWEEQ